MMKLVFITNSIGFGGAEKMMAFVVNGLAARGHRISVVNFNSIGDYVNQHQQSFAAGVEVHSYRAESYRKLSRIKKIIYTLKIVRKFKADVMVCFTTFPSYVGKIVSLLTGVPSIMSERGDPNRTINKKNLPSLVELIVVNQSAGGVFQIKGAAEFYAKRLQMKSVIIPNPIFIKGDVEPATRVEREKTIVSVGRLDNDQKRYDIMLKAFSIFSKEYPEWVLKLYGIGADTEKIKEWCKREGVEDKVLFMGLSNNPMMDTRTAGMFLITSDYEGISNSLLEAMAIGLPCVSTDSTPGGAMMLIENMENGLLAPIRNPEKIADAMCQFASDTQLADKCGENAKKVKERFAPESTLDKWEQYIKKIVG